MVTWPEKPPENADRVGHDGPMTIRRLTPEDSDLLRTLRLRALRDAPSAFGSTYEREEAFTDEEWRHRLRVDGHPHVVCEGPDGAALGLAAGVQDSGDATVGYLMAMWVAPEGRGSGVADLLIDRVVEWARDAGMATVRLRVTEGNARAERVYERNGFSRTGATIARDRDGVVEVEMERRLR